MGRYGMLSVGRYVAGSDLRFGLVTAIAILVAWQAYLNVPRANLALLALAGCIGLTVMFRYPILGTCAVAVLAASNLTVVLPTGFYLPLMIVTCVMVALQHLLRGDPTIPTSPLLIAYVLYAALNLMSVVWSPVYDELSLTIFVRILAAILVVTLTVRQPSHLVWVIVSAGIGLIISTSVTIHHMLTFFTTRSFVEVGMQHGIEKARYFGYWTDPNISGMAAVPVMALNYGVLRSKVGLIPRSLSFLSVIFGLIAVILSQSRSAGVMLLICLVILLYADKRRIMILCILGLCLYVFVSLVGVDFLARMTTLGKGSGDGSIAQRTEIARGAIDMFSRNLPLGVGVGNSRSFASDFSFTLRWGIPAHNAYLDALVELGIIGPFALLATFLTVLPSTRVRRWQIDSDNLEQNMGIAMFSTVMAIMVGQAVGSYAFFILFWFLLAIVGSRTRVFSAASSENRP